MRDVVAGSLPMRVAQEFNAVSRALDERFGKNAILRGDGDVANRLGPAQQRAFEAMRERLQILQKAVRADSNREIIAERRRRTINQGHPLTR